MPRSIWNGSVVFGELVVPVKLHAATHSESVHFREVHLEDGARIAHRRFCSAEDEEVGKDEIVKGFEVREDEYVVLTDGEIKAAAGDAAHVITVEQCSDLADIDPVVFDHAYHLGAGADGEHTYRLLHAALEETGRAAIGRFTFHNREYLVAIRPRGRALALHTLRFADELVGLRDVPVEKPSKPPGEREVAMAAQLVETLHAPWRPDDDRDTYRDAVLALIEAKAKGDEPPPAPEPDRAPTDDLMAALQASLKGARS